MAASDDEDETVLAAGSREGVARLHTQRKADTMEIVGFVISTVQSCYGLNLKSGVCPIVCDADGLGLGVADRLAELGCQVIRFRGGASPDDPRSYVNARAEAYGELGRRLDPGGPWPEPFALPRDPYLSAELSAPQKIYASDGLRYRITPKTRAGVNFVGDTIKEMLGRSPDRGDAVAYLSVAIRRLYWIEKLHINRPLVVDLEKMLGRPPVYESAAVREQGSAFPSSTAPWCQDGERVSRRKITASLGEIGMAGTLGGVVRGCQCCSAFLRYRGNLLLKGNRHAD